MVLFFSPQCWGLSQRQDKHCIWSYPPAPSLSSARDSEWIVVTKEQPGQSALPQPLVALILWAHILLAIEGAMAAR